MAISWVEFTILSALLPLITGLMVYSKLSKPLLLINLFVLGIFLFDVTSYIITKQFGLKNVWLYNIMFFYQYILLSYFFYILINSLRLKKLLIKIFIPGVLFILFNMLFWQGYSVLNNYSYIFLAVFVIFYSIMYLYEISRSNIKVSMPKLPVFWIITGLLICYMGTISILIFNNIIINFPISDYFKIWILYNFLTFIFYIFVTIAFILCRKTPIPLHS